MYRIGIGVCLVVSVLCGLSNGKSEANRYAPRIVSTKTDDRGYPMFHGLVGEDESLVLLEEPLRAEDDDDLGEAKLICGYRINKKEARRIPFTIEVIDTITGAANIKLSPKAKNLNYEKRKEYRFSISAWDCAPGARKYSERAWVVVTVLDRDDNPPTFEEESYYVELEEKRLYDHVVNVKAKDNDRSPQFGEICGYEIITPGEPFVIDKKGNIKNTEKLSYSKSTNHILAVVAEDCAHKRSQAVMVNIKVLKTCGWHGFPERLDYVPGSGLKAIAPKAQIQVCGQKCNITKVAVRMLLETKHIGKGCDRDTYSIKSQRHLCSASEGSVDLLPSPSDTMSWTQDLPTDDGHSSDRIFGFDGKINAVEVPMGQFNHHLEKHFTIATWMKHDRSENKPKEHILCMSDSAAMNRHHYSWYVHGDKLVFLLRREPEDTKDLEDFEPAEWRWHIPQINDNQWHHYAVSVNYPEIQLYIDGKLLIQEPKNPVTVDDWALHPTMRVNSTRLMVGACWQGAETSRKLDMFFRGYLAGLYILNGKTESDRVIKCLTNCKEMLEFHSLKKMDSGMTVSFNVDFTEVSITARTLAEVENIVREVSYVNARTYPTAGRRNLKVETGVVCAPEGNKVVAAPSIADVESYIVVLSSYDPVITLSGSQNLGRSVETLANGDKIFKSLKLEVSENKAEDEDEEDGKSKELKMKEGKDEQSTSYKKTENAFLLDKCTIRADPAMNLKLERLTFPRKLMDRLSMTEQQRMDSTETNEGVVITGLNKIEHYEMVLREIHYYHEDADKLSIRHFFIQCTTQNDRFTSNQLKITISAIHEEVKHHVEYQPPAAHAMQAKPLEVAQANVLHSGGGQQVIASAAAPSMGMVAIIVVCVGFLLFMIILGVIRIRAQHRRTQVVTLEEKQEMEWDNTALTITVNPLEQEVCPRENFDFGGEAEAMRNLRDDTDSDEDGSSFHDDLESSEDEAEKVKDRDLEWDDSTLSF